MSTLLSGSLLAATLLVSQVEPPGRIIVQDTVPTPIQGPAKGPMMNPAPSSRPVFGWFQREERPILSKVQNWFKRDTEREGIFQPLRPGGMRETPPPPLIAPAPAPAPINDFPRKLPISQNPVKGQPTAIAKDTPNPVRFEQPTVAPLPVATQPAPAQPGSEPMATNNRRYPIRAQFIEKIGRDDKFEWITGQLEIENNNYILYYATPETVDKYHGRIVVAATTNEFSTFRRGDLVSVRGQLTQRQTPQGMVPIYRVEQAHLIERPR